jgi:hypothetical protein
MVFAEMLAFVKSTQDIFNDEDIRALQNHLLENPESGVVIMGTGGVRKLRWAAKNKGKSGGVRVVYFYVRSDQWIYLLYAYLKNVKTDLTSSEKKAFLALTKELS